MNGLSFISGLRKLLFCSASHLTFKKAPVSERPADLLKDALFMNPALQFNCLTATGIFTQDLLQYESLAVGLEYLAHKPTLLSWPPASSSNCGANQKEHQGKVVNYPLPTISLMVPASDSPIRLGIFDTHMINSFSSKLEMVPKAFRC